MSEKQFTVMLPIHRSPELLPYAVKSVLSQTVEDFNLCIICDGAPRETIAVAKTLAETDQRITVHDFPKGKRLGEEHRHAVLEKANSTYVAQIADDDLWMNNHLSELTKLLQQVDFGNLPHVFLGPEDAIQTYPYDLANIKIQQRMLTENWNFFGPTVAGYRLSAYRQLGETWAPAPENMHSDLNMWRKFLRSEKTTVGTRFTITSFVLPNPFHGEKTLAAREADAAHWLQIIQTAEGQAQVQHAVLRFLVQTSMTSEEIQNDLLLFRSQVTQSRFYHFAHWLIGLRKKISAKWCAVKT